MNKVHYRNTCRCCGSEKLKSVVPMAPTPIGDAYLGKEELGRQTDLYPVNLHLCQDCGLAQLLAIVQPEAIYNDYIYKTSDSLGLVEHFNNAVDTILSKIELPSNSLVIDVGSNDGSYLKFYKDKGFNVLGIEPAEIISKEANERGIPTKNAFFTKNNAQALSEDGTLANLITINNCIANLDDLQDFIGGVKHLLCDGGHLVFETGYVLDLLNKKIFDNIYHEHLTYFSVRPLKLFFEACGMTLVDVERTLPKGGSLRCYVKNEAGCNNVAKSVNHLIALEEKEGIQTQERFEQFKNDLDKLGKRICETLIDLKSQGKTIAGYGASVGVTTALYNFKLKPLLEFLVDDNIRRQNLYSPGLEVPVLPPNELYERNIDYTIILAWMYQKPIMAKHKKYQENGGHFINILQDFSIF